MRIEGQKPKAGEPPSLYPGHETKVNRQNKIAEAP